MENYALGFREQEASCSRRDSSLKGIVSLTLPPLKKSRKECKANVAPCMLRSLISHLLLFALLRIASGEISSFLQTLFPSMFSMQLCFWSYTTLPFLCYLKRLSSFHGTLHLALMIKQVQNFQFSAILIAISNFLYQVGMYMIYNHMV